MNKEKVYQYLSAMTICIALIYFFHDYVIMTDRKIQKVYEYDFQRKSIHDIVVSMNEEAWRMVQGDDEKEQILGFVNIIERNHYLLYLKEISIESYYDFIDNILYPAQKANLKDKAQYAYQVNKYMKRKRKMNDLYVRYEIADPDFYYEDFSRNARVLVVRYTQRNIEYLTYFFRKHSGRYYFYLK